MRACAVEMHFNILQKNTGKMPRPKNYGTTLCASMRRRNALQHVTRATVYGNLQEKCRAPKLIGPHFVRACAVEMHFNMSQEPLYTEICRQNARTGAQTLCEPAQSKRMSTFHDKSHFIWKFTGKMRRPAGAP